MVVVKYYWYFLSKIIFSLLILLSISFNTKANHDEPLTLDGFTIMSDRIILKVYNKTQKEIYPSNYLWTIGFIDGADRKPNLLV